ncbi:MAG: hypothetical protein LBT85_03200, partial [Bifidobacteriaceae bacterium]|nr:hypothetical protein [Bifidobacteriaceae bacterium]
RKNIFILSLIPLFSVSFFAFPYLLLHEGPLLAYGAAQALLPIFLFVTLKFLQALSDDLLSDNKKNIIKYLCLLLLFAFLEILTQPRIIFSYILFILPFLVSFLIKFYKKNSKLTKKILIVLGISFLVIASILAVFVLTRLKKSLLLHPELWFSAHRSAHSFLHALLSGFTGGFLFTQSNFYTIILAFIFAAFLGFCLYRYFAQKIWELPSVFILGLVILVLADSKSGALGNILTAPWYHDENRLITFMPIIIICLVAYFLANQKTVGKILQTIPIFLIAILLFLGDPTRLWLAADLNKTTDLKTISPNSILTEYKVQAFEKMNSVIGKNDIVFGDPFTGLQYYYIYSGRSVYFPYINPRIDKKDEFRKVLLNFGVPDSYLGANPDLVLKNATFVESQNMLNTLCSVKTSANGKKFFVDFGAPYRKDMEVYKQFSGFRDEKSIEKYVDAGALRLVLQIPSGQNISFDKTGEFKIYQLNCS